MGPLLVAIAMACIFLFHTHGSGRSDAQPGPKVARLRGARRSAKASRTSKVTRKATDAATPDAVSCEQEARQALQSPPELASSAILAVEQQAGYAAVLQGLPDRLMPVVSVPGVLAADAVDLVIGVPTAKRNHDAHYLTSTLRGLFAGATPEGASPVHNCLSSDVSSTVGRVICAVCTITRCSVAIFLREVFSVLAQA
jgi:hypothetical protein